MTHHELLLKVLEEAFERPGERLATQRLVADVGSAGLSPDEAANAKERARENLVRFCGDLDARHPGTPRTRLPWELRARDEDRDAANDRELEIQETRRLDPPEGEQDGGDDNDD